MILAPFLWTSHIFAHFSKNTYFLRIFSVAGLAHPHSLLMHVTVAASSSPIASPEWEFWTSCGWWVGHTRTLPAKRVWPYFPIRVIFHWDALHQKKLFDVFSILTIFCPQEYPNEIFGRFLGTNIFGHPNRVTVPVPPHPTAIRPGSDLY